MDQQIIDNKSIAEFMEFKIRGNGEVAERSDGKQFLVINLKYHTDWNALMPVVEKIGITGGTNAYNRFCTVRITTGYTEIIGTKHRIFYMSSVEKSTLTATYKAVVEFIKWYNKEVK